MQEPIEEPKAEPIVEKLPWYKRLKNWLIGGATAVALTVGGVSVGINTEGHKDKPFYAVNPVTKDSLWYADTTAEYKAVVDSFSRIITYPEKVIPEYLAISEDLQDTTVIPMRVERPNTKFNTKLDPRNLEIKVGQVARAELYIDDKWVGSAVVKAENAPEVEGFSLVVDGKITIQLNKLTQDSGK